MEKEYIGYEITLRYQPGSLNPIDVNEQFLKECGLIDDLNKINRSLLRIGSLGTNILFTNESRDEIKVQQSMLSIESKSFERLDLITSALKEAFKDISIMDAEYSSHVHLIQEDFPQSIFKNYSKYEEITLDAVRFKTNSITITMHSCNKNTIHIELSNNKSIRKLFYDFDVTIDLEIDKMNDILDNFISMNIKTPNHG